MSTRSLICKEQADGSYFGIYCHSDGYLTYNGAMLLDHYSNEKRLDELLSLGDLSMLCEKIAPDPLLPHSFDYYERQEGVTVAYGRDRGETDIEARNITLEQAKESWCEYMYIFGRDGKWRYYDLNEKEPKLREVETVLDAEYRQMGISRPANLYGFFTQTEIDRIKTEQAQMDKSEAVM